MVPTHGSDDVAPGDGEEADGGSTAAGVQLKPEEVDLLVDATWRVVTKPQ